MKLGCRCIVRKFCRISELGVIAPCVRTTQKCGVELYTGHKDPEDDILKLL